MNVFILLRLWLILLFDGALKPLNHIYIMTERRNATLFTLDKNVYPTIFPNRHPNAVRQKKQKDEFILNSILHIHKLGDTMLD